MKRNFTVTMEYPADLFFSTDVESKIRDAAGYSSGSGMGFGKRDHSWADLTEDEAWALKDELDALKVAGSNVDYYEDAT